MPSPKKVNANAYSFSGFMFLDKFRKEGVSNYFQIRGWHLPEYKIFDTQEIRIQGDPVPFPVNNYSFKPLDLEVYINDDYFEYNYLLKWIQDVKNAREYLYTTPDVTTNATLLIMNTKENRIKLGLRLRFAYPEFLAQLPFERTLTPLTINLSLKYLDIQVLEPADYEGIEISVI